MSNRDGRRSKPNSRHVRFQIGHVCDNCGKGKYEGCDQRNKEGHEFHAWCKTCNHMNY